MAGNESRNRRQSLPKCSSSNSPTQPLAHEPCDSPPETLEERLSLGFPSRLLTLARATWLRLLLLVAGAIAVHLPALSGQLIWDDNYLVGENPFFRSPILSLEVFRHYLFLDSFSGHYRPVQNLSYMLDYLLWNGDPWGYHLSNTVWHASAGVLLFFLLRRLTAAWGSTERQKLYLETGSYLVALVWTLHPVHSAAVDYISGRADSLAFAFSAGAWLDLSARGGKPPTAPPDSRLRMCGVFHLAWPLLARNCVCLGGYISGAPDIFSARRLAASSHRLCRDVRADPGNVCWAPQASRVAPEAGVCQRMGCNALARASCCGPWVTTRA